MRDVQCAGLGIEVRKLKITRIFSLLLSIFIATAITALAQSNCVPVPTSYSVTDIGTLGGSTSQAIAINKAGVVTGTSDLPGDIDSHVFVWTSSGGIKDLGTLGGSFAVGTGINSAGNVVGYSLLSNNVTHAFLYTSAGGLQDLSSIIGPSGFSEANGIDDKNRIVGYSSTATNQNGDAVVWTGSTILDLGLDGATSSVANAINAKSQVVGAGGSAFLWTKAHGFKNLASLVDGDFTNASAVNNHGMVVGYDIGSFPPFPLAVVWTPTGIQSIGNLGDNYSDARGVNDQCQVVGDSILSDTTTEHAFIWTAAGGIQDLNNLIPAGSGWSLTVAFGINASGQIVGQGTIKGEQHGFLLSPM
jgi:probable HAF family extracellular repeat protein